jgi:hypothetical protein
MRYESESSRSGRVYTGSTPVVVPQSELLRLREKGQLHDVDGRPHLLIDENVLRPIVVVRTARRPI